MTPPRPAADYGDVSRWLLRRTTDLIAIALLAILAVTVGTRVIAWWRTTPGELVVDPQAAFSADVLSPWGIGPGGAEIGVGNSGMTLRRELLRGDLEQALLRAEEICREQAREVSTDPERQKAIHSLPMQEAEVRLLRGLARLPAQTQDAADGWAIHRIVGPVPTVLAVMPTSAAAEEARVVCCSLVMPQGEQTWSLLTLCLQGVGRGVSVSAGVPLPEGSRRILRLSDALGGSLTTFTGGEPADWQTHFDGMAAAGRWRVQRSWTRSGQGQSAAWTAEIDGHPQRLDVHFARGAGGWTGLISLAPLGHQDSTP